jgi:hypothetical protein
MNRRNFFQKALLAVSAISVFSSLAKAEERRRGGAANAGAGAAVLVDPNDPQAKAVNYKHDLNEIKDKALQTDRMGVKFKDQKCSGCVFYMKDKETNVAGKKAAPCQMPFAAGKVVAEKGWCSSWAKKA